MRAVLPPIFSGFGDPAVVHAAHEQAQHVLRDAVALRRALAGQRGGLVFAANICAPAVARSPAVARVGRIDVARRGSFATP
jgi:hypothetical protein